MKSVLNIAFELAKLLPPSRVDSIAGRLKILDPVEGITSVVSLVGSPFAKEVLQKFFDAWQSTNLSGETAALILQTASHTHHKTLKEQQLELVMTGPSTPFVSTRRTEQVILDLVREAKRELFVVSFVAYRWDAIIEALQDAVSQGVEVKVLLEASRVDGGSLKRDQSETLRKLVPKASIYYWTLRTDEFLFGKVHAKIVVSDQENAFLTSANLTGHAMEKNFEAGVLIRGGEIPRDISRHLQGLIDTKIITEA